MNTPDALRAAADWLEANRDNHIQLRLSDTSDENPFNPEATCFCAYGRFVRELGEPAQQLFDNDDGNRYEKIEAQTGVSFSRVYEVNDKDTDVVLPNGEEQGNADVIPFLRNLATELENKTQ